MDIANSPSCPCVCTDGVLGVHYQINETRRRVDGISELVLRGVLGCATSARKQASEQLATPAGAVRMTLSSLKPSRLFGLLVIFRIVNAVLCRTTFHADEYYQSLEIAHKLVFGYGWETWEWNPAVALRSPLHPLLFVPGYWILKVLGLDQTFLLVSFSSSSRRSPVKTASYTTAACRSSSRRYCKDSSRQSTTTTLHSWHTDSSRRMPIQTRR